MKYRHKVRGTEYEAIGTAELQNARAFDLRDGDRLVIYRGESGQLYARHHIEFNDGRFEPVAE